MRCAQQVVEAFLQLQRALSRASRAARPSASPRATGMQARRMRSSASSSTSSASARPSRRARVRDLAPTVRRARSCGSEVKRHFANLIDGLPDNEFCKTFFSSVTRKLFGTVGVSARTSSSSPPTWIRWPRCEGQHGDAPLSAGRQDLPALIGQLLSRSCSCRCALGRSRRAARRAVAATMERRSVRRSM